jgi:hypothetical protein
MKPILSEGVEIEFVCGIQPLPMEKAQNSKAAKRFPNLLNKPINITRSPQFEIQLEFRRLTFSSGTVKLK